MTGPCPVMRYFTVMVFDPHALQIAPRTEERAVVQGKRALAASEVFQELGKTEVAVVDLGQHHIAHLDGEEYIAAGFGRPFEGCPAGIVEVIQFLDSGITPQLEVGGARLQFGVRVGIRGESLERDRKAGFGGRRCRSPACGGRRRRRRSRSHGNALIKTGEQGIFKSDGLPMEILGVIASFLRAATHKRPDGSLDEFPGEPIFPQNPLLHDLPVGNALGFRKDLFFPLPLQVTTSLVAHVNPQKSQAVRQSVSRMALHSDCRW